MLRYARLVTRPAQLLRFTGLTPAQFATLAQRLTPLWQTAEQQRLTRPTRQRAIGAGRPYTLASLEDKMLPVLVFYRLYLTEELMSWLFGLHRSNVHRLLAKIEPLLTAAADPTLRTFLRTAKRRRRKIGRWEDFVQVYPDLAEVVIDATEQPRHRPPRRSQRRWYSGKRKRHTVKTQLTVSRRGRILHVSAPAPGRVHDYALFKRLHMTDRLPPDTPTYLDRGYDGAATDYPTARLVLPIKRRRHKRMLTLAERRFNHGQARQRIIVEHVIARLKKYQLLAQVYRHQLLAYGQRVRNIAALVNFRTPLLVGA
jgi:hypothetical protein